jgi:Family of unknown function (DUF6283)
MKQCKACPWKRSTVPERDIPGGYERTKHEALTCTLAKPGELNFGPLRVMACHETPIGRERPCVGWVAHQLGEGNNMALRWLARDGRFRDLQLDGEQCESLAETLEPRTQHTREL